VEFLQAADKKGITVYYRAGTHWRKSDYA
jgi:hypothetical protein